MVGLIEWAARSLPWLLLALGIIVLAAVPVFVARARRGSRARAATRTAQDVAVIASLVIIVGLTGRPGSALDADAIVNLRPFSDLFRAFSMSRPYVGVVVGNLVGNVLLFVPLGMALAVRYRDLGVVGATTICAGLSVAIEAYQAVSGTGRNADVTDVLMNTLGGLIGFVAIRAFGPARRRLPGTGGSPNRAG